MSSDVLVLNQSYMPIGLVDWQTAVKLWYENVATVEVSDEAKVLRSQCFEMGMPRVIRVKNAFTRMARKREVPTTRRNILVRDNATCQYCGDGVSTRSYTIDHVIPQCQGGKTTWENVVIACQECNHQKGGRTPQEAGMTLLSTPKAPKSGDPRFTFRLHINKMRKEWAPWADWLYYNVALDK